jgi:hypothetical protein
MTVLCEDESWLRHKCYTTEGPYLFPFYPNSNWKAARVFIVGLNPVVPFREEFDSYEHYWQALTQFPGEFERARSKKQQPKKRNKSRTQIRISELVSRLQPLNVLVTNIFAYPAVSPFGIPTELRREADENKVISRLIKICKPAVLFFHGREARLFANRYFKVELDAFSKPKDQWTTAVIQGATAPSTLFVYHHLVGRVEPHSVMEADLKEFAKQIHARVARYS